MITKKGNKQPHVIPEHKMLSLISAINKFGSTIMAIKTLKKSGVIDPNISIQTYKKNLYKMDEYKAFVKKREDKKNAKRKYILTLHKKGISYFEIVKKSNTCYNTVYSICNIYNKEKEQVIKKKQINKDAKNKVDYWSKTKFDGRIATQETLEAFKKLGLQI
jgi:hypothetical protein